MEFKVKIGGVGAILRTSEAGVVISSKGKEDTYAYEDIITIEEQSNGTDCKLHYIKEHPFPNHKLTKEVMSISIDGNLRSHLQTEVKNKIQTDTKRPKKLAVFVNPIGGKGNGKNICNRQVVPLLNLAGIHTDVVVSERAGHFKDLTKSYDFTTVDGLVIMGGDGTISEIMNVLVREEQAKAGIDYNDRNTDIKPVHFPIGVIPTGSACGVVKLVHGVNDVCTSTLHIIKGKTSLYNTIGCYNNNTLLGYGVICYGYIMYADLMYDTDVYFRWLRTLRYIFVPAYHLIIKSQREVDVEITYEYLENSEPMEITQEEKSQLKVTRRKKLCNIVGGVADLDFEDRPYDQQPELKDQFQCLDYRRSGKLELLKHFKEIHHLSAEHLESVKHFVTFSKIKCLHIRATDDNPERDRDLNLRFNIDGETHWMESPDVYIKLFPRTYAVYTSYKGSRRW